jgi:hypothetical protein
MTTPPCISVGIVPEILAILQLKLNALTHVGVKEGYVVNNPLPEGEGIG